jgi:hypothetical protein
MNRRTGYSLRAVLARLRIWAGLDFDKYKYRFQNRISENRERRMYEVSVFGVVKGQPLNGKGTYVVGLALIR